MTIENSRVIDLLSIDKERNKVVLSIVDHLEWDQNDDNHLWLLQEKINAYIEVIESGEMVETYPETGSMGKVIILHAKFPHPEKVNRILAHTVDVLAGIDVEFQVQLILD